MILEQVLEEAAYARPGYSLVAFKEAALPNYLLTTRLLTLEKKSLGPIEEACLGSISAGLGDPDDISSFLGLPRTRELLAARRIERREMHFLPCVMLFYRAISSNEVQVAFFLEEGFSLEHENAFRELGGPEQAGANHALAIPELPQLDDLIEGVSEKEKFEELLAIEQEATSHASEESAALVPAVSSIDGVQEATPVNEPNQAIARLRSMTQRCIRMHEHPGLLRKALTGSTERLLIVSPWITHHVIDNMFVMSLEALLRNGVEVTIGYGLADEDGAKGTDKAKQKPTITFLAERELSAIQKRFDNFKLVFLGNTHRKLLVSDSKFAVVTSFNWLSFRGDPSKKARDEFGFLVTEPDDVEGIFLDGMELVAKGYNGPVPGNSSSKSGVKK